MNWEYKVIQMYDRSSRESQDKDQSWLNKLGADGWCLVSVDRGTAYLRRPLFPAQPKDP